ncbi:MAG: 4-hydroxy-3-methylbut-2-en-1-yl diphosphate synthase [Chitinophagaceae bacterium]|nr:MAG: 4-hydroxy-3-methylbut-2-en-1-yl diphosphate synthase [Chitinophagaceae bacterium]
MQFYTESLTQYKRLQTREVKVGNLLLGAGHPIRVQTMTTTDTLDTMATVEQSIRCIQAGAEMVRITAPSKKDAENLQAIKDELHKRGYFTPLVADIHFTPNAAEIAARIVEKVRVNPGNYVDKKKFEQIEYTDAEYAEEIERIRERFTPLVLICKEHGTAMRIGTNHGSLSDRIMSRYGDTAIGMVESAMEFLRIARSEEYHNIILSMKSSNPLVMVQAYRLLIQHMMDEFSECYPLHLGVTEAGDGEDGRIKSAIGIGTLLQDGIGDTIRVSLTEDPEFEIPVCMDLVKDLPPGSSSTADAKSEENIKLPYSPFEYKKRVSNEVFNIGNKHLPVVLADFMQHDNIETTDLEAIGYSYNAATDKWNIADAAADIIYTGNKTISFNLPGTLNILCDHTTWLTQKDDPKYFPLFQGNEFLKATHRSSVANFISIDANADNAEIIKAISADKTVVLCVYASALNGMQTVRAFISRLMEEAVTAPVIIAVESMHETVDEQLIHFSIGAGAVFLDGMGDGIWLMNDPSKMIDQKVSGRTYLPTKNNHQFLNNTAFSILQAVRTRISKTEYISCPSCGRTLFDLQETTAKIRQVTNHLKGLKIAIMGCIVNGPGEMADADFGYVGSGPGKITLYRGKEVVKRNINSEVAVDELINLLRENDVWIDPVL